MDSNNQNIDPAESFADLENRIQIYQYNADPSGYDAILHEAVVAELSKRNPFFR